MGEIKIGLKKHPRFQHLIWTSASFDSHLGNNKKKRLHAELQNNQSDDFGIYTKNNMLLTITKQNYKIINWIHLTVCK